MTQRTLLLSLASTLLAAAALVPPRASAAPGDTTWVATFQDDFYNWATPHEQEFTFPPAQHWRKVLLRYRIGCPDSPADCDPWDRIGYLQVMRPVPGDTTGAIEGVEIARVITPYDITGPNRPGTCTWELDVSDYATLLAGDVVLNNYIESWIGGIRGWLVTIDFAFIEGEPEWIPYEVVNLWNHYYAVYGDPTRPIEDVFSPRDRLIPADAMAAKVRITTTGHGQGNTSNCAEFCNRQHTIVANGTPTSHNLWRSNCNQNPCSPQGGTWTAPRAGWCPGDKVDPWIVDVTSSVTPGETATFDYDVQPYTNLCCTCNPGCVAGPGCSNCAYDNNGHTEPIYALAAQLILYQQNPASDVSAELTSTGARLAQSAPNPARRETVIEYALEREGPVELQIFDANGRLVRTLARDSVPPGTHRATWDGRDARGERVPAGIYFYALETDRSVTSRKMLLLE